MIKKRRRGRVYAAAALICVGLMLLSALPVSALPVPEISDVSAAYAYCAENKTEIFSQNGDEKLSPASSVKVMTALLAYEKLSDRLSQTVTVTKAMLGEVTGNNIALADGENIKISELFRALLMRGANDAANVLAVLACGSEPAFVTAMNERASELGAKSTHYTNPTGLHSDAMYTTAADTARIAAEFSRCEDLMNWSSEPKYLMGATNIRSEYTYYNRNSLISKSETIKYYSASARGMNAGQTTEAGFSVVTSAEADGLTYIIVILGGKVTESTNAAYTAAKELITYCTEGFGYITVLKSTLRSAEIPVTLSDEADTVAAVPSGELTVFLPSDTDVASEISYSVKLTYESLEAPVSEGTEVGYITVMRGDTILGSVPLVTANSVGRSGFLYALDTISRITRSRFFIAAAAAAVVLSVTYVLVTAAVRQKKANRRRRRYR